jgi:hypothetical protein
MTSRKSKTVNKVQPLFAQSISYNIFGVCSAKMAEVLRGDDNSLDLACLYFTPLEPPPIDPGLNLDWKHEVQLQACSS